MNHPPPAKVEVPVPVQVVHNVVHLSSGSDLRALRCPHCEKRLVGARADGVDLNGCVACGGIWIDSASCQRVVARPREVFEELARRAAANARGPVTRARRPKCPVCDDAMDPVTVKEIPLDVCAEHGTWFDGRELEVLSAALRGVTVRGDVLRAASRTGDVPCVMCRAPIEAARANVGEHGPTCDPCWRARQQELIMIADARLEARSAGVGAGATALLLGIAGAMLTSRSDS